MAIAGTAIGIGALASAGLGYLGADAQADAAKEAQELTAQQAAQAAQDAENRAWTLSSSLSQDVAPEIAGYLGQARDEGMYQSAQGFGQGRADLLQGGQLGTDAISQGLGGQLDSLYSGADQGMQSLNTAQQGIDRSIQTGVYGANDVLSNAQDRAGKMLDQQGGLYAGFENDPGYQFRLAEGEKAINRANSAAGGRHGGAALKALQEHGQGVAAQSYNDFTNRRMQEFGAASSSDAQRGGLASQMANVYQNAGSQLAGHQANLGSQAANIAVGQGQNAANAYGGAAQNLASIHGQTGSQLSNAAIGAGQSQAGAETGYYTGLGDLAWKTANTGGNWLMGAEGMAAGMVPTLAASNAQQAQYAGGGLNAIGNALGQGAQFGMMYLGQRGDNPGTGG